MKMYDRSNPDADHIRIAGGPGDDPLEQVATWSDPVPLPVGLLPVPAFDPDFLPSEMRARAEDVAERMQVPLDFVGIPTLVATASLIGRRIGIRPQQRTDWLEAGNLWGCVVAPPGAKKSPAFDEALTPLRRLEVEAAGRYDHEMEEHKRAMVFHKIEREAAEAKAKAELKKGLRASAEAAMQVQEPEEPCRTRYIVTRFSVEKLGEMCRENPQGFLVQRDELLTMLRDLDRSEKDNDRGFLLQAWGGKSPYDFNTLSRGTTFIPAVNLSLLGTTQPGPLTAYLRDSLANRNDGMVQRLQLLAWPDMPTAFRLVDQYPDSDARHAADACIDRLSHLNPDAIGAERDPFDRGQGVPFLRFTPEAQAMFDAWLVGLEGRLRDPDHLPAFVEHLSKYRGLVPRLALVCHIAGGGSGPVGVDPVRQALALAAYLEAHAMRTYHSAVSDSAATARAIWRRIARGHLTDGFTLRDTYRQQWSGLTDKARNAEALALLVEHDWLAAKEVRTGGRPSATYHINPKACA